jgi:hypothetical protein
MKVKSLWPVLLVFAACSTAPSLVSYFVSTGVMQYFLPPTNWTVRGSKAKALLDITCRTETGIPAIVNISFFGEKSIPRRITSISFNGRGVDIPLENIAILYPDPKKRELRITAEGNRDALISVLEAEPITLTAEIDGQRYTFIPDKKFISLKNDFVLAASYY